MIQRTKIDRSSRRVRGHAVKDSSVPESVRLPLSFSMDGKRGKTARKSKIAKMTRRLRLFEGVCLWRVLNEKFWREERVHCQEHTSSGSLRVLPLVVSVYRPGGGRSYFYHLNFALSWNSWKVTFSSSVHFRQIFFAKEHYHTIDFLWENANNVKWQRASCERVTSAIHTFGDLTDVSLAKCMHRRLNMSSISEKGSFSKLKGWKCFKKSLNVKTLEC